MSSALRVLLFSHETTLSGAPMQLLYLATWLKKNKWTVTVAAPEAGPISDELKSAGVSAILDQRLLADPERAALRALCRQFDVVVANTIAAFPVVYAAHAEGVRVIWYLHETLVAISLMEQLPKIRPALQLADLIVTPTQRTAALYQPLTRTRIEVVPYGIPEFQAPEKRLDGRTNFLVLGTYEPRKGQDVTLDAIDQLDQPTKAKCGFTFAGRPLFPEFFMKLQERAATMSNVELLSDTKHAKARDLIARSDVLVCSSRDETMPIAILEAMSARRAILSTDVGGISEWIYDGLNGVVVPAENAAALAGAFAKLHTDAPFRSALAAAGRRTFERHFQLDTFGHRFARLIENAGRPGEFATQDPYSAWVAEFDTLSAADRVALCRELRLLPHQPLISVVVPVFNPEPRFLQSAIDSVKRQIYSRWELCIADDASTHDHVRPLLEAAAQSDPRIKVIFRRTNGHISACSNSALALATGEWCALLDHDDELAENALAEVAAEINRHADAGLIYSDEDKIDEANVRSNPFFKTDWNPELFLGQNYINHLGVYRTDLLREIGGFREGFEGSQDYDLALRCIERLAPAQIRHIPRVLYHWRTAAGSLAAVVDAKPYAREAARRALADHLERSGVAGRVTACPENPESHRVIYSLGETSPRVSVVILTRDKVALLQQCVNSIRKGTEYPKIEFVIVDNGSVEPETHSYLRRLEGDGVAQVLRENTPFNFSRLNNLGAHAADGEILAFVNNDIEVSDRGWLTEMVSHAIRPLVGAVGARLWYPKGTLQHGGVVLGLGGVAGHAHHRVPRGHPGYYNRAFLQGNYSAITGACLVVRKSLFDELRGFNENDLAVNFNDVDFCLRVRRRGLENVWTPYANLLHHESASRGHHRTETEQAQFAREANYMQQVWGAELLNDPFYSPNLSLNLPGFELAIPPRRRELSR